MSNAIIFHCVSGWTNAPQCLGHAAGGAVGWGTALQAGRSRVRFPMMSLEFFYLHNPSGRTMALGLTQTLTEMSTSSISWVGKGGRCVRLTTLPPSCAVVMKSGNLNFLAPSEPLQACNGTSLHFVENGKKNLPNDCYVNPIHINTLSLACNQITVNCGQRNLC